MIGCNPELRDTAKTQRRSDHAGEVRPIVVQIAGADPDMMADAARYNVERGAQVIDINMGCPAKKVCNVAAGSALLRNEPLVGAILERVVGAVDVPVTLKIRTGWSRGERNAVRVACIAQDAGVAALSIHGRTRECAFVGAVEYDTIREVKRSVAIPVIANGDVDSPEKAREVLESTGADGLMIGRAAQGRPWIFREIRHFLDRGEHLPPPDVEEMRGIVLEHLADHYAFYGEFAGVRIARKHLAWYAAGLSGGEEFRHEVNKLETSAAQIAAVNRLFDRIAVHAARLDPAAYVAAPWGEEALAA
jgi:tRNA-dihydrouridine synthase B